MSSEWMWSEGESKVEAKDSYVRREKYMYVLAAEAAAAEMKRSRRKKRYKSLYRDLCSAENVPHRW